jgi:hypothetical protein
MGEARPVGAPLPAPSPDGPLSDADFERLRQAAASRRPVRAAARVATGSAATILVVAVLSLPFALLSPGLTEVLVTLALSVITWMEYAGAAKMRRGEPAAASVLGWNQVVFIGLIALYCISRMLDAGSVEGQLSPAVREQLSQAPDLARELGSLIPTLTYAVYGVVILLSVMIQGSLAWYYFSRRRHLESLHSSTPAWIRRVFREIEG